MPQTPALKLIVGLAASLAFGLALMGCSSSPMPSDTTTGMAAPKADLQFVDLQGFDRELSGSLSAPLPKVDVAFYDRITPSAMPERLQQWMASVEAGGGNVKVVPPKSTVAAKSPFLLISAATSIWSASKMAKELATRAQFKAAQSYDAEIILKVDDKGETLVDKVVFLQRKK